MLFTVMDCTFLQLFLRMFCFTFGLLISQVLSKIYNTYMWCLCVNIINSVHIIDYIDKYVRHNMEAEYG